MMYAVLFNGAILVRALPSMQVAEKIAGDVGGKAIVDPRSVQR